VRTGSTGRSFVRGCTDLYGESRQAFAEGTTGVGSTQA